MNKKEFVLIVIALVVVLIGIVLVVMVIKKQKQKQEQIQFHKCNNGYGYYEHGCFVRCEESGIGVRELKTNTSGQSCVYFGTGICDSLIQRDAAAAEYRIGIGTTKNKRLKP